MTTDDMSEVEKIRNFREELVHLLNTYSMDSATGVQDFILAEYVTAQLDLLAIMHAQMKYLSDGEKSDESIS